MVWIFESLPRVARVSLKKLQSTIQHKAIKYITRETQVAFYRGTHSGKKTHFYHVQKNRREPPCNKISSTNTASSTASIGLPSHHVIVILAALLIFKGVMLILGLLSFGGLCVCPVTWSQASLSFFPCLLLHLFSIFQTIATLRRDCVRASVCFVFVFESDNEFTTSQK